MKRWVYIAPDGRQFSVYARDAEAAFGLLNANHRVVWSGARPSHMGIFLRPLADEPVTLVDWSGR